MTPAQRAFTLEALYGIIHVERFSTECYDDDHKPKEIAKVKPISTLKWYLPSCWWGTPLARKQLATNGVSGLVSGLGKSHALGYVRGKTFFALERLSEFQTMNVGPKASRLPGFPRERTACKSFRARPSSRMTQVFIPYFGIPDLDALLCDPEESDRTIRYKPPGKPTRQSGVSSLARSRLLEPAPPLGCAGAAHRAPLEPKPLSVSVTSARKQMKTRNRRKLSPGSSFH